MKYIYFLFVAFFITYLVWPLDTFPNKVQDSLQSGEPADIETTLRRGYFTDKTREEVLTHYKNEFQSGVGSFNFPVFRLNYPPEEAGTIIRDQTRSTFLEELAMPLRQSLYINGFEPKDNKDSIVVEEKNWRQKVIVKIVDSPTLLRLLIGIGISLLIPMVYIEWKKTLADIFAKLTKNLSFAK